MTTTRLFKGEQLLIQTVDKKLLLTTHRVIRRRIPWTLFGNKSVMLEDIEGWEVKATGNALYLCFSVAAALMVYFNDSFALLSGFFLMLYLMTRHRRVHVKTTDKRVLVLPLEVQEKRLGSLIDVVRQAQQARIAQLKKNRRKLRKGLIV